MPIPIPDSTDEAAHVDAQLDRLNAAIESYNRTAMTLPNGPALVEALSNRLNQIVPRRRTPEQCEDLVDAVVESLTAWEADVRSRQLLALRKSATTQPAAKKTLSVIKIEQQPIYVQIPEAPAQPTPEPFDIEVVRDANGLPVRYVRVPCGE